MRIALVSTPCVAVPPVSYGGTELIVAELAAGLTALGHDVTTFATGDSSPAGSLRWRFPSAEWPPDPYGDLAQSLFAWREIERERPAFDVVHLHVPAAIPFARYHDVPALYTVHSARSAGGAALYGDCASVTYVMISAQQASTYPEVGAPVIVHHGLDPASYALGDGDGGYLAFLGRFAREKGPHTAIDAASRAGLALHMGGEPHPVDAQFHADEMVPRLSWAGIERLGNVGPAKKRTLLGGARALLFPIEWDEPFGLVMIESMLCGTPVIAFRRGSVAEVVEDGATGFVVDTLDEMVDAIGRARTLDRGYIRARAVGRWGRERMARDHVGAYANAIERHRARGRLSYAPAMTDALATALAARGERG